MKLAKTQRQHRIAQLLEQQPVTSQAQLVELLAAGGVEATQATVSRDLEEIGAVKVRVAGGESVYAVPELPKDRVAPEDHLRRVLGDWVVEVARVGQPGRRPHPARLGPRGGLGPRPGRACRHPRHRGRRRHHPGGRRRTGRRRQGGAAALAGLAGL